MLFCVCVCVFVCVCVKERNVCYSQVHSHYKAQRKIVAVPNKYPELHVFVTSAPCASLMQWRDSDRTVTEPVHNARTQSLQKLRFLGSFEG